MKRQTNIGKAFEINKDPGIYGAFAEIGAGQETVGFFYRAGLASQTVAKSMSAYDMTVSDEIYGRQNRYVGKKRLITMLSHEYRLLQKRLRQKFGKKKSFFAFATTASAGARKQDVLFAGNPRAWMGLLFQARPLQAPSSIHFYLNCLDRDRLQQHEAIGILGLNLIYACYRRAGHPRQFIASLAENLSVSRVEIHGISSSGPAFKKFSAPALNLQLLSQGLGPLVFFSRPEICEPFSEVAFEKQPVVVYGDLQIARAFKKSKLRILKSLGLSARQVLCMAFLPPDQIQKPSVQKSLNELCRGGIFALTAVESELEGLKRLISLYSSKPLVFIISEKYFKDRVFDPRFCANHFLLKSLGSFFDNKTKLAVLSGKGFSVAGHKLKSNQSQALKDYLVARKQIVDIC